MNKTCPVCGKKFAAHNSRHVYCSLVCHHQAEHMRKAAREGRTYQPRRKPDPIIVPRIRTIDDVVRAAAFAGLSYGEYVAKFED